MLIALTWLGLLYWHWHMARRASKKLLVKDAERALAGKLNRWVRLGFVWGLALWVLFFVAHMRATATRDAANYAMSECKWWLRAAYQPLQECVAPAQAVYVDSAGTAATTEVFLWVLGVL